MARKRRSWSERSHKRVESKEGYTKAYSRKYILRKLKSGEISTKEEFLELVTGGGVGNIKNIENLYFRPSPIDKTP